jgi:hypothetical protein
MKKLTIYFLAGVVLISLHSCTSHKTATEKQIEKQEQQKKNHPCPTGDC